MAYQDHIDPLVAILVGCCDFVDNGFGHGYCGWVTIEFPDPSRLKDEGFTH